MENGVYSSPDLERYMKQMERKRAYNQRYYQEKTKPKKDLEKEELTFLRDKCTLLEDQSKVQDDYIRLAEKYNDLLAQHDNLKQINVSLNRALEEARQKNYQLLMLNAGQILPPLGSTSQ